MYPALKVARLATDARCEKMGIGKYMVYAFISMVGCRYITVDSKPESVEFY